ncbi:HlyD family efflux transporter periplasmic adaptor subunit [Thermopetrobacter sp. TC1]|uniref:HlyD family efflux transporter periplasmic adaptor subunit n=1 Tax=Thermopetrobacter sp. TC1 TaxID=1495045 RepID=UPI00068C45E2|nr:HlyD family efflux transporter periplasmic adaptor subunit [Thermopetrobacter sp. TC1]
MTAQLHIAARDGITPQDDDLGEAAEKDVPLPPLREDLRLMPAGRDAARGKGWLIFDPVRNRYFHITRTMARALACWQAGSVFRLCEALKAEYGLDVSEEGVAAMLRFLASNGLLAVAGGGWKGLVRQAQAHRQPLWKRILHGYLFFRIPLVKPQRWLERLLPHVLWLGRPAGLFLVLVIGLFGLFMTLRQWDVFSATFARSLTAEGLMLHALALVFVKTAHELGHALTALRFGCRVPTMGVAFLVMMPMLYTDVGDAWRVRDHKKRLLISAAGILVELALAGVALFLWAFLPDGPGRAAAYFVAVTSLVGTLAINASPFMRFDGYHILADILSMHNLQPRAFALALWHLRQVLLGLKEAPPEQFPSRLARGLILYAWASWIYRLLLFTGIALLVYHAFPKVLGLPLAGVGIWFFVLKPVGGVVRDWWSRRGEVLRQGRPLRPLLILAGLMLFLVLPIWHTVQAPAVLLAGQEAEIRAPEAARIDEIHIRPGERVEAGTVLATLHSPELAHALKRARIRLRLVEVQLARLAASRTLLEKKAVLEKRRAALLAEIAGLEKRRAALVLKAPVSGQLRDVARGLRPGGWVERGALLARIADGAGQRAAALIVETEVRRIKPGAKAWFIADDPTRARVPLVLTRIDAARREGRDIAYLASVHGGPVAAERDERGAIRLRRGMFPLRLRARMDGFPEKADLCPQACRGRVIVEAEPESLLVRIMRRVFFVIFRGAGF